VTPKEFENLQGKSNQDLSPRSSLFAKSATCW
jgi:hypothetical protein